MHNANQKTGIKKNEKGNRSNCMVDFLSIIIILACRSDAFQEFQHWKNVFFLIE
jgi:hypothetical protein